MTFLQEAVIGENNDTIEELQRQIDRIKEAIARSKKGLPIKEKKKKKGQKGGAVSGVLTLYRCCEIAIVFEMQEQLNSI